MASPTALDYISIKETLSRYCIAIDKKNFDLRDFFTPDVHAKYPGPMFEDVRDLETLEKAVEKSIAAVSTHHALTTQSIDIADDGKTAKATTYFTCTHFGRGEWEGKFLVAWGRYEDVLVLAEGKGALPDCRGKWLVKEREMVIVGLDGEMGVMGGVTAE